jgi:WD40 repeat protein
MYAPICLLQEFTCFSYISEMKKHLILYGLIILFINGFAQAPKLVLPIGNTGWIRHANFSPNGKYVVTASDNELMIWNVASGQLLYRIMGSFFYAEFSPDMKFIVTTSLFGSKIKIWDAITGILVKELIGHNSSIYSAKYNYDGKLLLTASADSTSKIWDITNSKIKTEYKGHSTYVKDAGYSPDEKYIVTADKSIKIWEVSGKFKKEFKKCHLGNISSVKFSPDGQYLLSVSETDNVAKVWDIETGNNVAKFTHSRNLKSASFSPNGKLVLTTDQFNDVKIWDTETGNVLIALIGHEMNVSSAEFSPDGKTIVTASHDKSAIIWDVATGKKLTILKGHTEIANFAGFNIDDSKIITVSNNNMARLWNFQNGVSIQKFNYSLGNRTVTSVDYSPNGQYIATVTEYSDSVKIWNQLTGELSKKFIIQSAISSAIFSPNSKEIATSGEDGKICIVNVEDGKVIKRMKVHNSNVIYANYSPDGRYIVSTSIDSSARIWNTANNQLVSELKGHSYWVSSAMFSPNGKHILTSAWDGTAKVWNIKDGRLIRNIIDPNSVLSSMYSPDGKKILTSSDTDAKIWDLTSEKKIIALSGHDGRVNSAKYNHDGKKIVTCSNDNTIKVWDSSKGKITYTFFPVDSIDYFVQAQNGYYLATSSAAKLLHYVTPDLKVITFEQLDVKYNRPDKVLEAIGCKDTALINSYRKAYYKRIKKLGIDTASFRGGYSVPESDFENRDAIEDEQKTDNLSLHIKGGDSTYKLDRFNIWINEIPLFGQKGFNIKKRNTNVLDTTITIQLSKGNNKIETSILNVNGTESYRMPLQVNYSPEIKLKEKLHFVGIGIDKFADSTYNLQYSVKDIRDLSKKLKEKFGDGVSIDTLFNENVTIANVKDVKKKLLKTSINDKVIISYSGHGLLSKDYDYYLSTYSVYFDKPQENGLPYDELENLLDSIPARKKLMLIDACHSGEVDKDEEFAMNNTADSMGLSKPKGGKTINSKSNQQLGLKNSFELMQSLFVNVGKSTGATIISAAAGNQFALEKGNLKNGVFTYCILEAMNTNSTMTISQLKSTVGKRVEELTNGLQKPTSRNETINSDWSVW